MKRIFSLIVLVASMILAMDASAQMTKKEAKEWKKRIKSTSPDQFKRMVDDNKSLKNQVASLKTELGNVDSRIAEKDEAISSYEAQIADLRNELSKAQAKTQSAGEQRVATKSAGGNIDENKGVVFKVQIGAFTKKDLSKYLDNARNFSGEQEDGVRKYTIGVFRDYWDADTFKKYLREMGVKDAWIVAYRDGKRVDIKEVLENVSKKG